MSTDAQPRSDRLRRDPSRPIARLVVFVALILLAAVPVLPSLLTPHYPPTHETFRYEELTFLFRDAIAHGSLYPRWLPDLAGGMGYPTFIFYPPMVFWVSSLVSLLPIEPARWVTPVAYLFSLLGACGAYRLARLWVGRPHAVVAAPLLLFSPYLYVNLYIRGDISEIAAMMILPWAIYSLMLMRERLDPRQGEDRPEGIEPRSPLATRRRILVPALIGALSIAGLIVSHPAVAIFSVPLLGGIALAQWFALDQQRRRRWLQLTASASILGVAIAAPYWFGVWFCGPFVSLDRLSQGYYSAENHTVPLSVLLSNHWSFGMSGGDVVQQETMPLPLGIAHATLAVLGIVFGWRKRWVISFSIAYVTLVFLISSYATPLWSHPANPLRVIQFPWRLLGIVAVLQLVLILPLLARIRWVWLVVAIGVCVAGIQWKMFRTSPMPQPLGDQAKHLTWHEASQMIRDRVKALPFGRQSYAIMNEFDPKWREYLAEPRGDGPLATSLAAVSFNSDHTRYRISATIDAPQATGVRIEQFYFPGWYVAVNGNPISDRALRDAVLDDGRMIVPVPAGKSTLLAYYNGPPWAMTRNVVAILVSVCSLWILIRLDRQRDGVAKAFDSSKHTERESSSSV